jgi:hypothetical protein
MKLEKSESLMPELVLWRFNFSGGFWGPWCRSPFCALASWAFARSPVIRNSRFWPWLVKLPEVNHHD